MGTAAGPELIAFSKAGGLRIYPLWRVNLDLIRPYRYVRYS